MKRLALKSSLNAKLKDDEIQVLDECKINKPKTKTVWEILKNLELIDKGNTLFVLNEKDENVMISCRNIKGLTLRRLTDLNCYDILNHVWLLMTKDAFLNLPLCIKGTKKG